MTFSYIKRTLHDTVKNYLKNFPAVAILGPRQSGKSTLARQIVKELGNAIYLDLEKASDLQKLSEPEMFFNLHREELICLDEIQRTPELFSHLRSIIDERGTNGQFLILGSASQKLIRQTSESLAGRIVFLELLPFSFQEIPPKKNETTLFCYWIRGGFPRSYLAKNDEISFVWRENFIRTFLERDISQLGFRIPAETLRRLWQICAHQHGQLLNLSNLGQAMGLSHTTIRVYIELLSQTFMLRILSPISGNIKKRLVKSPKIYLRDSGLLPALLGIRNMDELLGHPIYGASWEGLMLENVLQNFSSWKAGFYRTAAGAELDLVLERAGKKIGVEFKASPSPKISRGFWNALEDLQIEQAFIIAPVKESFPIHKNVWVMALEDFLGKNV